jgi:hypothetical protein
MSLDIQTRLRLARLKRSDFVWLEYVATQTFDLFGSEQACMEAHAYE